MQVLWNIQRWMDGWFKSFAWLDNNVVWQERALCGRELEEHPLVDLLPTESEVEETIMTAATNVEGLAPEAGQLETLKQSLGQHTKSEERSESQ